MRVLVTKFQKVERVAFAPEGTHLFASGLHSGSLGYSHSDEGIGVFDLADSSPNPAAHHFAQRSVNWFAAVSGGRLAVFSAETYGGLYAFDWRASNAEPINETGWQVVLPCAVAPDGSRLIAGLACRQLSRPTRADRAFRCWQLPGGVALHPAWRLDLALDRLPFQVSFTPDSRSFWTAEWAKATGTAAWGMELIPRDAATGKPLRDPIAYPNQKITGLALSSTHAVAHDGPTLFVYDLANLDRKPKKIMNPAKRKHFGGFALHPSGKWLAAAGLDGAVTLWDTATWTVARTWVWDAGQARSVCFSADGTLAAAGTDSGKVVVWDLDV